MHGAVKVRVPLRLRAVRACLAVTCASVVLTLAACSGGATDTSLFPLDAGHRWSYRVSTERENNTVETESLELLSEGRDDIDSVPTWKRRSTSGAHYWLRTDDSGIFRVASRSDLDADPERDPAPRYVLKKPYVVGTQWSSPTTAYLLKRRQDFPSEVRYTHPSIPMNYVIEAVGLKVDTALGPREGCLRVKGSGVVKLYADGVVGWKDLPLTTSEWYCPGIGLVRLERTEPAESTFISGGRLTMELTDFH